MELANRAPKLYESSKEEQKRQLVNLLLSNCKLRGAKLIFNITTPFDMIARCSNRQDWLRGSDSNRQPNGYT
jgi:hypothetical protein